MPALLAAFDNAPRDGVRRADRCIAGSLIEIGDPRAVATIREAIENKPEGSVRQYYEEGLRRLEALAPP